MKLSNCRKGRRINRKIKIPGYRYRSEDQLFLTNELNSLLTRFKPKDVPALSFQGGESKVFLLISQQMSANSRCANIPWFSQETLTWSLALTVEGCRIQPPSVSPPLPHSVLRVSCSAYTIATDESCFISIFERKISLQIQFPSS